MTDVPAWHLSDLSLARASTSQKGDTTTSNALNASPTVGLDLASANTNEPLFDFQAWSNQPFETPSTDRMALGVGLDTFSMSYDGLDDLLGMLL